MKGDVPAAAVRLLCACPVRTHSVPDERQRVGLKPGQRPSNLGKSRVVTGVGRGGNQGKRIVVDGVEYPSIKDARRKLRVGSHGIRQLKFSGRLKYV